MCKGHNNFKWKWLGFQTIPNLKTILTTGNDGWTNILFESRSSVENRMMHMLANRKQTQDSFP